MSSQDSSIETEVADYLRRRKHAEAQRRYCDRKLDETRAQARKRMARMRFNRTEQELEAFTQKRRADDADYRELMRARKFRNTYSDEAFLDLYYPQYQLQDKHHLPGLRFDEKELKKRLEEKERCDRREKRRKANAAAKKANVANERQGVARNKDLNSNRFVHEMEEAGRVGWLYLRNQARANNNQFALLLRLPWAQRRPCRAEFFADPLNFKSRSEHDKNRRKMYFVVPDRGIFTKLVDALEWVDGQDDIDAALTMNKALKITDAHCRRHHQHGEVVPDSELDEERSPTPPAPAPSRTSAVSSRTPAAASTSSRSPGIPSPSLSRTSVRGPPSKSTPRATPMPSKVKVERGSIKVERGSHFAASPSKVKLEHTSIKREELKCDGDTPSPKRRLFTDDEDDEMPAQPDNHIHATPRKHINDAHDEDHVVTMLSLYVDDSASEDENVAPSRKRTSRSRSVSIPPGGSDVKRARGSHSPAPTVAISPTVSSVSSLSTASSVSVHTAAPSLPFRTTAPPPPFRNLAESVSMGPRPSPRPAAAIARKAPTAAKSAPARRAGSTAPGTSAFAARGVSLHGGSTARGGSSHAAARPATVHLGPAALQTFLKSGEPVRYSPSTLQQVLEEDGTAADSPPAGFLLFNSTTRTLFKNTETAIREMGENESMQMVKEYVSGRVGGF
ncbi:hypothetical protein C8R43DRAFT_944912 [Mycena crocata]|nr:hypothetical protein C8R43DRAFT_944912 [Mycena crocata]